MIKIRAFYFEFLNIIPPEIKNLVLSNILQLLDFIFREEMGNYQFRQMRPQRDSMSQNHNSSSEVGTKIPPKSLTKSSSPLNELSFHDNVPIPPNEAEQAKYRVEKEELNENEKAEEDRIKVQQDLLVLMSTLMEKTIQQLNNTFRKVLDNVNELIISKKPYKIRQNFRSLVLEIIQAENLEFFLMHESGRIEYQNFEENFITEIMETDQKYFSLHQIINSTSQQFHLVDISDNSEYAKVFQIDPLQIKRNTHYGVCYNSVLSDGDETFYICMMIRKLKQTPIDEIYENLQLKICCKIVEISMISTPEQSNQTICRQYSKKMLDWLQMLLINILKRVLKKTCSLGSLNKDENFSCNLKSVFKAIVLNKLSQQIKQKKPTIINTINRLISVIQEIQFNKIQEIRMFKKYVRDGGSIFLEFDRNGVLVFISRNKDNPILNHLSSIWEPTKSIMQEAFDSHSKLLQKLQTALRGSLKSNRPFEVTEEITAKIILDNKKISKVHLFISDLDNSSQSNSLLERDILMKSINNIRKPKSYGTIQEIQKENPGIIEDGWIELFLKNNQSVKRKNDARKMKTYMPNQHINQDSDEQPFSTTLSVRSNSLSVKNSKDLGLDGLELYNPNFDILKFQSDELEMLVMKTFKMLKEFKPILENKKLLKRFENFVSDLHSHYELHENPFHNFKHGVNVMHICYLLCTLPANSSYLTNKDIFATVFSGLCHDVGHFGYTNTFQIASQTKRALLYNDVSPMENYHASTTFQLLKKDKNNFLCQLPIEQFKKFRKLVISNILFTDIKQHFPLLKKFNQNIGKINKNENSEILANMIVHSSDFGGVIKEFDIAEQWALRINKEYTHQYHKEKELGLPQTPFMKDLDIRSILAKNQAGFLKVIVLPLYQALNVMYQSPDLLTNFLNNLNNNIKRWQEILKQETEQPEQ